MGVWGGMRDRATKQLEGRGRSDQGLTQGFCSDWKDGLPLDGINNIMETAFEEQCFSV